MTDHPELERIFCDLRAALAPPAVDDAPVFARPRPSEAELIHNMQERLKKSMARTDFYRAVIRTQVAMLGRAADALRAYFDADLVARHVVRDIERNVRAAHVALGQCEGSL